MQQVADKLLRDDVRLVTLVGPGGVGKTRLAVEVAGEVAHHFADGVWFVALATLTDPTLVVPTIAQTLDLHAQPGQQNTPLDLVKTASP